MDMKNKLNSLVVTVKNSSFQLSIGNGILGKEDLFRVVSFINTKLGATPQLDTPTEDNTQTNNKSN